MNVIRSRGYSIFAIFALLSLPAFAWDATNDTDLESSDISEAAGIISVIANINISDNQSAQNITGWTYIIRDEGNCTGYLKSMQGQNLTMQAMPVDCLENLMVIDEDDINFAKAVEVIQKSLSDETTCDRIFLVKHLNLTEPIWSFSTLDGKTISVGARSGEILVAARDWS